MAIPSHITPKSGTLRWRMIVYSTMVEAEEQLPCGDKGETASQSQSGHREWFFLYFRQISEHYDSPRWSLMDFLKV